MRSAASRSGVIVLVAGLAHGLACGGHALLKARPAGDDGGGGGGAAGARATGDGGGEAGVAGASLADAGGGGLVGSDAGGADGQGSTGANGDDGSADASAGSGDDASSADGGADALAPGLGFGGSDLAAVVPTPGCGKSPTQELGTFVRSTIVTGGIKDASCADSKCGQWTYVREYYLQLPIGYDANKPYPLFIEGTGNGGKGNQLYQLPALAGTAIRVGLTPPPPEIGHSTNPNQACYDDREGDDSVEFPFYEGLYDRLAFTVCFDRNRVFAGGPSSSCGGAWLANELGCKYAGDPDRPVRGVMVNNGGLPTDVKFAPTCTKKPMAGIWVHSIGNTSSPFSGNIVAMNRALAVNGCLPVGVTYATATFEPFPITATDGFSCKRFTGCPAATPLVVCPLPLNDTSLHEGVVNPAWSTFFKLFQAPPLLGP